MEGKAAFGALFAASRTLRSVAVVQRAIRWATAMGVLPEVPRHGSGSACGPATAPAIVTSPSTDLGAGCRCSQLTCLAGPGPNARRTDPAEYMADLGFGEVELVSSFSVSMSGELGLQQLKGH